MTGFAPTSVILYVTEVEASTTFYHQALSKEPIETFDGFAVFALTENVTIGLQTRDQIDPAATARQAASSCP